MKVTQAIIMCGGYGKRLGKITLTTPKPLIKINNLTVLEHIIKNLTRFGIEKIYLLCHYKYEVFKKKFHKKKLFGAKIFCIKEKNLLGSSGALFNARKYLEKNFLFCNGDTFFDLNISDLIYEYFNKKTIAFLAFKKISSPKRYDTFKLSKNKELRLDLNRNSHLINSGICIFSKKIIPYLIKKGSLEKQVFTKLIKEKKIHGKEYKNNFLDMGVARTLKKLPNFLEKINYKPCLFLDRDGVINKDLGYVYQKKKIKWKKNIFEFIKKYNDENYYIIIVTNQSGIGRGYYKEKDLFLLHKWMVNKIREKGGNIDKIYYSPYYKNSHIKKYRKNKKMRKPQTGMIDKAKSEFQINIKKSIFIGDSEIDKLVAIRSGIKYKIIKFNEKLL